MVKASGPDLGQGGGAVVTMSHIFIGYSFLVPRQVGDLFRAAVGLQVKKKEMGPVVWAEAREPSRWRRQPLACEQG